MLTDTVDPSDLARLLPMYMLLDAEGAIIASGPTMRKISGAVRQIEEAFTLERPQLRDGATMAQTLAAAAEGGMRIFLRQTSPPYTVLRGHAVPVGGGRLALNLGFGIGLPQAVGQLQLTDADFAPSDLAIELLFLHEANSAAMLALSRHNASLEEARLAAELESTTDPLTGLANRRGLDAALARLAPALEAGPSGRRQPVEAAPFCVLQLDLDGFKGVNDRYGHAAGDELLRHVARVLREEMRSGDVIGRPGGDEFTIVMHGAPDQTRLAMLARRIVRRLEAPVHLAGGPTTVSASIGIARSGDYRGRTLEVMTGDADTALYDAKRAGRGRAFLAGGPGERSVPLMDGPAREGADNVGPTVIPLAVAAADQRGAVAGERS